MIQRLIASLSTLWFYDYFLTLSDEVSTFPILRQQALCDIPRTDKVCLVRKEVIWFVTLPNFRLSSSKHSSFLVVYLGAATPHPR
jgi:hypothetical protein